MLWYVKSVKSLPEWQLAHFALPLNSESPSVSCAVSPLPVLRYVSNRESNPAALAALILILF